MRINKKDIAAILVFVALIIVFVALVNNITGKGNRREMDIVKDAVKNATLAMVAPPIAEALIATAMGLFAAIPAVVAYNRFNTRVEKLENAYMNFMDELSTILNRKII